MGCHSSPPGDLHNPGIKPASLMSPVSAGMFFTTSATWEALVWILTTKTILTGKVPVKNPNLEIPSHRV